ncbi:hypothetical protein KSP40_PGU007681 [Platanthera guangdongensis]|uniref:X8 domain-containing protein n=1 Tax=Platanthera guangdongensis TaxID=2320717 RepID=A0ABR2LLN0_9ASPA
MAGRSRASISLPFITFWLLLLFLNSGGAPNIKEEQKTWCVAKPSTSEAALNANLNFACAHVDCLVLQKECAFPESLISHASIAMNLYYQANGRNSWNCFFSDSALIVVTDPSKMSNEFFTEIQKKENLFLMCFFLGCSCRF